MLCLPPTKKDDFMFSAACAEARKFTFPILLSFRHHDGTCKCGMGAFVVINEEGWAVTAFHIISQIKKLEESQNQYSELISKRQSIENNTSLKKHEQMRQLGLLKISPKSITHFSTYLSGLGTGIGQIFALPDVDLAAFKINDFKPASVASYPKFKDHAKPMNQGTSLCKMGYPFHDIEPTFDMGTNAFQLPPGALPVPNFPLEGIYAREFYGADPANTPYPYKFIETSSPGLRGQSGGPTFDIHGNIWAIQSSTRSLRLGFGENAGNSKEAEHIKNQYLNVGLGVHSETVTNFLTSNRITFLTSPN